MKLIILGATGATGQQLVSQALEQGHEVTAIVRNPSKLGFQNANLKIIAGDILNVELLKKDFAGKDVLLSALGVGKSLKSNDFISKVVKAIIPAMNASGLNRIIFISAFGVGETFSQASLIQKMAYRIFLKNVYADKKAGENYIRSSALDWTLIHPALLTDGPFTGKYRFGESLKMKGMPKISRADVAHFILGETSKNQFIKRSVTISY